MLFRRYEVAGGHHGGVVLAGPHSSMTNLDLRYVPHHDIPYLPLQHKEIPLHSMLDNRKMDVVSASLSFTSSLAQC